MNLRVCRVVELSRDEAVLNGCCQLICLGDGPLHALGAVCQNNLCTVSFQDVSALHAHGLRHGEDHAVALGCCDGCQADTGVTGSGLDDDGAGL